MQTVCRRENRAQPEFSEAGLNALKNESPVSPICDVHEGVEQNVMEQSPEDSAESASPAEAEDAEAIEPKVMKAPKRPSRE